MRGRLLPALLCVLAACPGWAQLDVSRRADGVVVISNNPDRVLTSSQLSALARRTPGSSISASLRGLIHRYSVRERLDPRLVEAVIHVESGFDASAISRKGAMGLMQLMPQTARSLGVRDAFDVNENLRGGTRYLRQMIDHFGGDLRLALAGYNAGPGAVERYRGVPPFSETSSYVRRVLAVYRGSPAWGSTDGSLQRAGVVSGEARDRRATSPSPGSGEPAGSR